MLSLAPKLNLTDFRLFFGLIPSFFFWGESSSDLIDPWEELLHLRGSLFYRNSLEPHLEMSKLESPKLLTTGVNIDAFVRFISSFCVSG